MAKTSDNLKKEDCNAEDAFGHFGIVSLPKTHNDIYECSNCGEYMSHYMLYAHRTLKLPDNIDITKTILKRSTNILGINCGCYARFHRQVAHIQDQMRARAKK